jgi:hypothetical protein
VPIEKYSRMTCTAVHRSEELPNHPLKINMPLENVKGFFCLVTGRTLLVSEISYSRLKK